MPVRVLSAQDVQAITDNLSAPVLLDMMAKTLATISAAAESEPARPAAVQNPLRISTESPLHQTLYMPSRLATADSADTAVKVVANPKPGCTVPGLPGTTLLMDETTGAVRAVVNSGELTGLRTAAASALATRTFAEPDSRRLVIFGSGVQAYFHARLILELFPSLQHVDFIVRSRNARTDSLQEKVSQRFNSVKVQVRESREVDEVLSKADIVCTCVPSTLPLFDAAMLKEGVHINAIGSYTPRMFEFPPDLVNKEAQSSIPQIVVDSRSACLAEAGELIAAKVIPERTTELGELFDPVSGLLRDDEKTTAALANLRRTGKSLFKCVGIGGMDVAITRLVVDTAEKQASGSVVPY